MKVDETLSQRKNVHGDFIQSSDTRHALIMAMQAPQTNYHKLPYACQRALDMIAEKITRILHGNGTFEDHWHDIAGYATLIDNQIKKIKEGTDDPD